jgi:hypothetical protein
MSHILIYLVFSLVGPACYWKEEKIYNSSFNQWLMTTDSVKSF